MAKMPIPFVTPPDQPRATFKHVVLLALTVAVLVFCAVLWLR